MKVFREVSTLFTSTVVEYWFRSCLKQWNVKISGGWWYLKRRGSFEIRRWLARREAGLCSRVRFLDWYNAVCPEGGRRVQEQWESFVHIASTLCEVDAPLNTPCCSNGHSTVDVSKLEHRLYSTLTSPQMKVYCNSELSFKTMTALEHTLRANY